MIGQQSASLILVLSKNAFQTFRAKRKMDISIVIEVQNYIQYIVYYIYLHVTEPCANKYPRAPTMTVQHYSTVTGYRKESFNKSV